MNSEMCVEMMRRESFQGFNILGGFSHDPVIAKQTAFKKLVTLESKNTSKNKNPHFQTLP